MIRNLKALMLAAMALAAFGAIGASGAQAAEFHCQNAPCTWTLQTDGTGKTAHHVIEWKNSIGEVTALTCEGLTGEATSSTKTATTLTFKNLAYHGCTFVTWPSALVMNGCEYVVTSHGAVTIVCPAGKRIEYGPANCIVTIGPQGPLNSLSFHNEGTSGTTSTQVTFSTNLTNIAMTFAPGATKAGCNGFDPTKTPIVGTYTTGNTTITAEEDKASGAPTESWWA